MYSTCSFKNKVSFSRTLVCVRILSQAARFTAPPALSPGVGARRGLWCRLLLVRRAWDRGINTSLSSISTGGCRECVKLMLQGGRITWTWTEPLRLSHSMQMVYCVCVDTFSFFLCDILYMTAFGWSQVGSVRETQFQGGESRPWRGRHRAHLPLHPSWGAAAAERRRRNQGDEPTHQEVHHRFCSKSRQGTRFSCVWCRTEPRLKASFSIMNP